MGPASVGYHLTKEALVFGGSTPTLTDAAVVAGRVDLGDAGPLEGHGDVLTRALATAERCSPRPSTG